jgi:hypothetical protein
LAILRYIYFSYIYPFFASEMVPLRCEEGRPKAVRNKVAGKGQQFRWLIQIRPDLSSEGAPDIDKTVNVKQKLISGHEPQMGLDTKMDWSTDRQS